MVEIVPTLLCQTAEELQAGVERWQDIVPLVQIDLADGKFVDNTLPGPEAINQLQTTLKFEVHLMVQQPAEYLDQLLSNSNIVHYILHIESDGDLTQMIDFIHRSGQEVSLAVRPETVLSKVAPFLPKLDGVLLLGVNPGFNGSSFLPEVADRVIALRHQWPSGRIEVDGGIGLKTIGPVVKAGANRVAVGSFLAEGDAAEQLASLRASLS